MTNLIRAFLAVSTVVILSACGGGGGSPGNTSGGAALFTTSAEKIVIAPGEVQNYVIGGGVPSYSVTTNSNAASATVSGKNLVITGTGSGSATIIITDATGAKVLINATVGTGVDFHTTAPSDITVGVGFNSSIYELGGGTTIYTVATSNRQVVTVTQINGRQFYLTGIGAGTATITMSDSLGATRTANVTVGTTVNLYTTAPASVVVGVGTSSAVYTIGGGSQVYSISSSDISVATVGQTNSREFIITGQTGGKAKVTVKDSLGKEVSIDVVVGTTDALFSTAAANITVPVGGSNSFKVGGGSTIYSVGSSNASIATATIVGNDLTITGVSAGAATITVRDSTNGVLTISTNVGSGGGSPLYTTAASDIVVNSGTSPNFTIGGGKAPYLVSSSNPAVLTATVSSNSLSMTGLVAGSSKVIVTDSAGAVVTINTVVGSGSAIALFTTSPSSVTLASGVSAQYAIAGGTAPYTVTSSNTAVANALASGLAFSLAGVSAGNATAVVRDALGAQVSISITVSPAGSASPIDVLPGDATGSVGDVLTFKISGGSAPFTITNNNGSIASVTPTSAGAGGTFTATLLNVGATPVNVVDAQGQTKKITITATSVSSQLRISPAVFMVSENSVNPIDLNIYGGTPPYRVFTSDLVLSSVSVSGSVLTVAVGSQATRCVAVKDSGGTVILGGSYIITITALDSLGASATTTMSIKDNFLGGALCL